LQNKENSLYINYYKQEDVKPLFLVNFIVETDGFTLSSLKISLFYTKSSIITAKI